MATTINADNVTGGAIVTGDASGQLELQAAGVTKATISSGGMALASALPVSSGGTGAATHTTNSVLIGNGTSAITSVAPGTAGNVLTSDGTNWTSGTISSGIGAITADSFVATLPYGLTICASPNELDAGHSFTHEGNFINSANQVLEGVCYSSYHGAWFCQGSNLNNSNTTSDRCVYKSYDGIHWTALFKISERISTINMPSNASTSNGYSYLVVDDSNGRLWVAASETSGSYRLRLYYYDFNGDFGTATEVFATGDPSGNQDSAVEYMQWLPNTQAIIIFYRNTSTTGQLKKAYILAGGTTITYDQTFSPGAGQPYRYGFALDDTNNKYYIQNDSNKAYTYSGTSPHTASWTQRTKSSGTTDFNENGQMAIGGGYIVFPNNSSLYYMDTTSTWTSTTGWTNNSSAFQSGAEIYGCYYDETNSRFVAIGTFGIYTSSTPNTGAWTYKAGSGLGTVSYAGDLKAIRAHS